MLRRMLGWTAVAALALVGAPAFASVPGYDCPVSDEVSWSPMDTCAPPIALDQHYDTKVIEEMVSSHLTTVESVSEHEETVHAHQYASLEEIEELTEEP